MHSSRRRTGRSCAITSSGMAGAAAMRGTRPAAPARSLAGAPRTGKERPIPIKAAKLVREPRG